MGSICVSSAPILRCISLTQTENIALIIPVALEFATSSSFLFFNRGFGGRHLLLLTEGWVYFTLAMLELLLAFPHTSQANLSRFHAFDMAIGIASFLPLILYTLFLYLFARGELFKNLPPYVKIVAQVALLFSLPAIVATNEIASVVGLTINPNPSGTLYSLYFSTERDESFWLVFTSLTLGILTAFQATIFCFIVYRLVFILARRNSEQYDAASHEVRGIVWVSAGVKIGALESLLGFAGGSFGIALARRIMRFSSRVCLCIGLSMRNDSTKVGTYDNLEKQANGNNPKSRSSMLRMISGPRLSTFQELSPTATEFHTASRAVGTAPASRVDVATLAGMKGSHYLTFTQRQRLSAMQSAGGNAKAGLQGMTQFATLKERIAKQRVTVLHDVQGGPPLLQMRFSSLEVPEPAITADALGDRSNGITKSKPPKKHPIASAKDPVSQQLWNVALQDIDEDELQKPNLPFAHQKTGSQISTTSISSTVPSPIELVSLPRRTFSQRRAKARIFQASKSLVEQSQPDSSSSVYDPTEVQSISTKSVCDSIQAVHEFASQFPGPPLLLSVDQPENPLQLTFGASEEDDNDSIDMCPQAVGSPSNFAGGPRRTQSLETICVSLDETISCGHQDSFDTANHLHGDRVPASLSNANCTLLPGHHPQQSSKARFEYSQGLEERFTATATPTTLLSSRRLSPPSDRQNFRHRSVGEADLCDSPAPFSSRFEVQMKPPIRPVYMTMRSKANPSVQPIVIPPRNGNLPRVVQVE